MSASKTATVEDASPSPPPIPRKLSNPSADIPINSLGEEEDEDTGGPSRRSSNQNAEESEEEWDPSVERLPGDSEKRKGKRKAEDVEGDHPWQAVWSPEKNAWYFWNTKTGEVTWTNPLAPTDSSAPPLPPGPAPSTSSSYPQSNGVPLVDPSLAFLLPAEARGGPSDPASQSAMFNARTGRFTANDAYSVDHLDEYNRMKRMNNAYFDHDSWEKEMQAHHAKKKRDEEMGIQPKSISKKDMERFRKKKQEKKMRGQAWLRD